jgi:hypothetical protein
MTVASFPALEPAVEWRSARLLYELYTVLAREFMLDLPVCDELEKAQETSSKESLEAARAWFLQADGRIAVHQLRQFLQTNPRANEAGLLATLQHHLRKPHADDLDRDKLDFLLVQYFSVCAALPLQQREVSLEYVARTLEPAVGKVELTPPESLHQLEELIRATEGFHGLQDLFTAAFLEKGRGIKHACGDEYFTPAALVAATRFNFLMRRAFFRLMHQDLNAILDGLRKLESRGVQTLDCRRADFSAEEPVNRLRMICQSWKVMFQAEYSSGQPLRLLVELRSVIDAAVERLQQAADGSAPDKPLARAAAASGDGPDGPSSTEDDA